VPSRISGAIRAAAGIKAASGAISLVLLALYVVAVWAMAGKPA
jgi:hypothetical protein